MQPGCTLAIAAWLGYDQGRRRRCGVLLSQGGNEDRLNGVQAFSAWSNTMLAPELKTSPVTSRPEVMPVSSMISRPTMVFGSWKAGRLHELYGRFPMPAAAPS